MPLLLLFGRASSTHTAGGTSQLSGFGSSGGVNVFTVNTVGGTDQLAAFGSSGGLNVFTIIPVGGTSQLLGFTSTGSILVVSATPAVEAEREGREGGAYGGYQKAMRRKKMIRQDDEEFMQMATQALTEMLRKLH